MNKLSFKEYLESKKRLKESVEATSKCKASYDITKYCKLVIGEKDNKSNIALKPKNRIIVEWFYTNSDSPPSPLNIKFQGNPEIEDSEYSTYWSGEKLLKWLSKNTIQNLD